MEMRDFVKLIAKNIRLIFIATAFGALLGFFVYNLPRKYIAQGTLFVSRSVQSNLNGFFGYEGYYGEQAANAYTNTAMALAESIDIRKKAMEKAGVEINDFNLFNFGRMIRVKKAGPQVLTLSIKTGTYSEAEKLWNAVAESVIEVNKDLNQNGDPYMTISKASSAPVVKQSYYYSWQFSLAGGFLLAVISVMYLAFRNYLKGTNK
jgi:capsular polysaccharide biosynthesis protein